LFSYLYKDSVIRRELSCHLPIGQRLILESQNVVLEATPLPTPMISNLGPNADESTASDGTSRQITVVKQPSIADHTVGTRKTVAFQSSSPQTIVVLLNNIVDPQNVGSIIRSAHFFGIAAVVLPTRKTADLSSGSVLKAASGAAEAVNVFLAPDVDRFISKSWKEGWLVLAATVEEPDDDGDSVIQTRQTLGKKKTQLAVGGETPALDKIVHHDGQPILLVLGSEERGIQKDLLWHAHGFLNIRRSGEDSVGVDSLNVGVAAGILFTELTRVPKTSLPAAAPSEDGEPAEKPEKMW
jgi:21S rRNA (GM2251-2'-O)-methyltransferase